MKTISRMRRGLAAMAVVGASFMAVSAAPAMASPHWSDTAHGIKLAGSLQLSAYGKETTTCAVPTTQTAEFLGSTGAYVRTPTNAWGALELTCGGVKAEMEFMMNATSTTSLELIVPGGYPAWKSPWAYETYWQNSSVAAFANGSAETPSTLTFSNVKIGSLKGTGAWVYANGSLNVTTSSGGLLTLLP